jgi:hypothetical protein
MALQPQHVVAAVVTALSVHPGRVTYTRHFTSTRNMAFVRYAAAQATNACGIVESTDVQLEPDQPGRIKSFSAIVVTASHETTDQGMR